MGMGGLLYADMSHCYSQLCHIFIVNPHVRRACVRARWLPCPLEDEKEQGKE